MEFGKSCEDHPGKIARLHHTDQKQMGFAERAVRRVKEGTSAVLLQSGLNEKWWADSTQCYTCLRNVTDLLSDGKTPYERRFGQPFKGPIIPFGSLVATSSSIHCCGTRFGNSVVTILPLQNKDVSGNSEEPTEVLGADKETKSHSH